MDRTRRFRLSQEAHPGGAVQRLDGDTPAGDLVTVTRRLRPSCGGRVHGCRRLSHSVRACRSVCIGVRVPATSPALPGPPKGSLKAAAAALAASPRCYSRLLPSGGSLPLPHRSSAPVARAAFGEAVRARARLCSVTICSAILQKTSRERADCHPSRARWWRPLGGSNALLRSKLAAVAGAGARRAGRQGVYPPPPEATRRPTGGGTWPDRRPVAASFAGGPGHGGAHVGCTSRGDQTKPIRPHGGRRPSPQHSDLKHPGMP